MYNKFFGFKEKPFKLVPNPEYLFLSKSHEEALAHLTYAISHGDGFVEITGEVGTGKTTLCRVFLENLDKSIEAAYIFNPKLDALQLLRAINDELGIDSAPDNTKDLIDRLNEFLIDKKRSGQKVLVLIDEAQNLSHEVLEQLRLLSNLETTQEKLLQIILVGQPELGDMLSSHQLRQLGQRITINCQLAPLTFKETKDYIRHRIALASHRAGPPFDKASYRAIYEYSRGVPRLINIACDRTLLNAFSRNSFNITGAITKEAIDELTRKRVKPARRSLQTPTTLAILAAICIPLIIFLLYRSGSNLPETTAVSQQTAPPSAEQSAMEQTVPALQHDSEPEILPAPSTTAQPAAAAPVQPVEPAASSADAASRAAQSPSADTDTVAPAPTAPDTQNDAGGKTETASLYSIHAGVFTSAVEADARLAAVKALGFPGFISAIENGAGKTDFMVFAGNYPSLDLAKEAGSRLSDEGFRNFITSAEKTPAAATIAAVQLEHAPVDAQGQENKKDAETFKAYLQSLDLSTARDRAIAEILQLWFPATEIYIMPGKTGPDRTFFQKVAAHYDLLVQPVATASDLALIQSLNLPAIFTFYLQDNSGPKYLAVTKIAGEKIYLGPDEQGQEMAVDREIFLRNWSGEAYILWKNFNNLQGVISQRSGGAEVKGLKGLLRQIGYNSVSMSDRYGKDTLQIIKHIQTKYGLQIDGLVGPFTKIALYNESPLFSKPSLVKPAEAPTEAGN
ncbi:MAG: AAA family ATPase [Desulfobulbales bacterium]